MILIYIEYNLVLIRYDHSYYYVWMIGNPGLGLFNSALNNC